MLFLQFGSKYAFYNDEFYTDGSLNEKIWNRYLNYTNNLTVLGRKANKKVDVENIQKLNKVPNSIKVILLDDVYNPKINYLNLFLRSKIKSIIRKNIDKNDKIIIRSVTNYYNLYAANYCIKKNKDFLVEITGFGFESLWYHDNILGKIISIVTEIKMKKVIKKSPNVLYVTNCALQKRYPTKNNKIGCSDVEIDFEKSVIDSKKKNFLESFSKSNAVVGTIGPINSKVKGQESVIKALSFINKQYNYNIKYELVGRGNKEYLLSIARKYNFENNIKFVGEIQHEKIFEWLDNIDIYIQPSYQEGLCRSILEAMSRGCIVFASNAGGNVELVSSKYIFNKGNYKEIKKIFEVFQKNDIDYIIEEQCEVLKKYEKTKLQEIRDEFYKKFINGGVND